jgi:hypothetical protein
VQYKIIQKIAAKRIAMCKNGFLFSAKFSSMLYDGTSFNRGGGGEENTVAPCQEMQTNIVVGSTTHPSFFGLFATVLLIVEMLPEHL